MPRTVSHRVLLFTSSDLQSKTVITVPTLQRRKPQVQSERVTCPRSGYMEPGCQPLVWVEVHVLSTILASEEDRTPRQRKTHCGGQEGPPATPRSPRPGALAGKLSHLGQNKTTGRRRGVGGVGGHCPCLEPAGPAHSRTPGGLEEALGEVRLCSPFCLSCV